MGTANPTAANHRVRCAWTKRTLTAAFASASTDAPPPSAFGPVLDETISAPPQLPPPAGAGCPLTTGSGGDHQSFTALGTPPEQVARPAAAYSAVDRPDEPLRL